MGGFTNNPLAARAASHRGWSNTVDRTARTRKATSASPVSVEYHLSRLGPQFDNATPAQRLAAAESARKAHMATIAAKSAEARRKRSAA